MRTRNQSKRGKESPETLTDLSGEAIGKIIRRANSSSSSRTKGYSGPLQCEAVGMPGSGSKSNDKQNVGIAECCGKTVDENASLEKDAEGIREGENDELEWEDGLIPISDSNDKHSYDRPTEVTVECDVSPDPVKRKPVRKVSAEDRELAELVHKVHLLCLLARGRLIDNACNDHLLQASLLSILPRYLLKISEVKKITARALVPLVNWFHENFHVRDPSNEERSFPSALARALETRGGSPEEVAALAVALFRSLNLTSRFVSILDVASLKPEAELSERSSQSASRAGGVFSSATPMVHRQNQVSASSKESPMKKNSNSASPDKLKMSDSVASAVANVSPEACSSKVGSKRKGDLEFEMQLAVALSATAIGVPGNNLSPDGKVINDSSLNISNQKRIKRIKGEVSSSSSHGISTAIGSKKAGPPLYWAEIYCSGENMTGRWVHVDTVNAIIDGEQNVEAAAGACKTSLRYVVAFSGHGAKDVTRRYCMQWYKISSQRINSDWWDVVLAPLKQLESNATIGHDSLPGGLNDNLSEEDCMKVGAESEDLDLETRALTEPLPTNQLAYKNHHLYALERWLTRYQIIHPKGPVLGFCSGHAVYPRTCVQILKAKERWFREGLQVKATELPVKVLKSAVKHGNAEADDDSDADHGRTVPLYGKWQVEPLCLPHAVNGIVPKNERGQVDVWSEKCLPPGTVHLRLARIFTVAKRLEIDYAPAMVGFDFRNGRCVPVFDGIVVCAEFKDAILEAYSEEQEKRANEEKKRNEGQAISRWCQLLSSIVTRRRLNSCYGGGGELSETSGAVQKMKSLAEIGDESRRTECLRRSVSEDCKPHCLTGVVEGHEHVFMAGERSFEGGTGVRVKRCECGFSIEVEEL